MKLLKSLIPLSLILLLPNVNADGGSGSNASTTCSGVAACPAGQAGSVFHGGNIRVVGFDGLLMQFVQAQGGQMVIRGLRAASDFEYEFQLAGMNRKLYPKLETLFMTPAEEFMFISSSLVREVARLGGDVNQFVSPGVETAIKQKLAAA